MLRRKILVGENNSYERFKKGNEVSEEKLKQQIAEYEQRAIEQTEQQEEKESNPETITGEKQERSVSSWTTRKKRRVFGLLAAMILVMAGVVWYQYATSYKLYENPLFYMKNGKISLLTNGQDGVKEGVNLQDNNGSMLDYLTHLHGTQYGLFQEDESGQNFFYPSAITSGDNGIYYDLMMQNRKTKKETLVANEVIDYQITKSGEVIYRTQSNKGLYGYHPNKGNTYTYSEGVTIRVYHMNEEKDKVLWIELNQDGSGNVRFQQVGEKKNTTTLVESERVGTMSFAQDLSCIYYERDSDVYMADQEGQPKLLIKNAVILSGVFTDQRNGIYIGERLEKQIDVQDYIKQNQTISSQILEELYSYIDQLQYGFMKVYYYEPVEDTMTVMSENTFYEGEGIREEEQYEFFSYNVLEDYEPNLIDMKDITDVGSLFDAIMQQIWGGLQYVTVAYGNVIVDYDVAYSVCFDKKTNVGYYLNRNQYNQVSYGDILNEVVRFEMVDGQVTKSEVYDTDVWALYQNIDGDIYYYKEVLDPSQSSGYRYDLFCNQTKVIENCSYKSATWDSDWNEYSYIKNRNGYAGTGTLVVVSGKSEYEIEQVSAYQKLDQGVYAVLQGDVGNQVVSIYKNGLEEWKDQGSIQLIPTCKEYWDSEL